ncbi:hypothetical protein [Micromonospora tarensis]|uniref:DUF3168 domain-containing protein n=1 Tax=Micromonospora tarensis TaxID=2806100 RepID=A0ABS1Y9Q7_9ACTN|nr:hypothetical protein [Micromonospora tarensis]MBM0274132.1 hypothetical protein [Micromonospora tarensis]
MSLVGDRAAIAAVLSTIDGVTGYASRPSVLAAGDAWPLLGPLDRASGYSFTATWRVFVIIPSDEVKASEWLDAHVDELVEALLPVGFVDQILPVAVTTEAGDLLAAQITMRSE